MQDTNDSQVFNFQDHFSSPQGEQTKLAPAQSTSVPHMGGEQDLLQALIAAGEATYHWDIPTDQITWSANAPDVLCCSTESISTGRHFANLLDSENLISRYEAVMYSSTQDQGQGVPFQIEYVFRSAGRRSPTSIRLEDTGRWQAGSDGMPTTVRGIVHRIDERHNRDQHLTFLGATDPLTGMMNRGRMTEALSEAIVSNTKSGKKCAFVIASINQLDLVNDASVSYTHLTLPTIYSV